MMTNKFHMVFFKTKCHLNFNSLGKKRVREYSNSFFELQSAQVRNQGQLTAILKKNLNRRRQLKYRNAIDRQKAARQLTCANHSQ